MRKKNKQKLSGKLMKAYLAAGGGTQGGDSERAIQTAVNQHAGSRNQGGNRGQRGVDERQERLQQAVVNMEYQQQLLSQHVLFTGRVQVDRRGSFDERNPQEGGRNYDSANFRGSDGSSKSSFHRGS